MLDEGSVFNEMKDEEYTITPELAQEIAEKILTLTGFYTIVCDTNGIIIGANKKERIGNPHTGAQLIMAGKCDEYAVTAEMEAANPLTKQGLNLPITISDKRLGTFGIGGQVHIVRPVASFAADLISMRVREGVQKDIVIEIVKEIISEIKRATDALMALSSSSIESAQSTTQVAKIADETSRKVLNTNQILEISKEIAGQINLLGLNASIEAARAGEHGRGFSIVSSKIQRLSTDSSDSAKSINKILSEIQASIKQVSDATRQSANFSNTQAASIQDVLKVMNSLQGLVLELENSFN